MTAGANNVILTTRSQYELYSGDLDVSVSIPDTLNTSSASLELVSLLDDRRVTTYQIPLGFVGDISVTCGAVDFAGQFVFQLVNDDPDRHVVASTSPVNVSWPASAVTLSLPSSHHALTSSLHLSVDVASLQCDSVHQGVYYMLQLLYLGRDEADAGYHSPQVINSRKFATLTSLGAQQMSYTCTLIDQAGIYQAVLTASHDNEFVVARSNRLNVLWSEAYRLDVDVDTVLPCSRRLVVAFTQPSCSRNDDKLRLYAQPDRRSLSSRDLRYVTERRVINDATSVSFECRLFKPADISYCFKYVSTANNGAVHEQTTICLPTSNSTGQLFISCKQRHL